MSVLPFVGVNTECGKVLGSVPFNECCLLWFCLVYLSVDILLVGV